jgi:hypothetical protein
MGSHGISGIEEILLGSNTEKVRLSEVPVMVIKKETTDFKGEHFVLLLIFRRKKAFQKMLNYKNFQQLVFGDDLHAKQF